MRARTTGRWRGRAAGGSQRRRTCGRSVTAARCSPTCSARRDGRRGHAGADLIVIDAACRARPRQGGGRGAQGRPQDQAHPGRRPRARRRSRDGRLLLRRRREHVHRQAGHVPRARAADEGLHGLLAGDRRTAARAGRVAPWPPRSPTRSASSPSPPTTRATRRSARCCSAPDRPRDDARRGAPARPRRARTTSCWWTARSSRRAWTACSPAELVRRRRRRR